MKNIAQVILVIFFFAACSTAGPPAWFLKGSHPRYQMEFYFVGAGSGGSFEAAQQQALSEIARQIEVKIESRMENIVSSYAEDDREHISAELKSVSKTFAEASLKGVQVAEKAVENNTYYVLCVVDKDNYLAGLLQELDLQAKTLRKFYENSESLIKDGKVFPAIETLMETTDLATEFYAGAELYTSLSRKPYSTDDIISGPALLLKVRETLGKIRLEKVSGDGQSNKSGNLLAKPLVVKVGCEVNRGEIIPMPGVKLCLKDEENRIIERAHSDEEGVGEFWIYAVGENRVKTRITLDLRHLPIVFKRDLRELSAVFTYTVVSTAPLTFRVRIYDKKGVNRLPTVENTVAKSVEKAGHHVSDDAPFLLSGNVELVESHKVDGVSGPQYLAKTELTLFMQLGASGENVGSMTITSEGLDKNSEKSAVKKSYKRLKVSRREMSKMLASAGDKLQEYNERLSKEAFRRGKTLYEQNRLEEALFQLARVNEGEDYIAESQRLIKEIKDNLARRKYYD